MNLNTTDFEGKTPLHLAVNIPEDKIFTHLISTGADINSKDMNNQTARDLIQDPARLAMFDLYVKNSEYMDQLLITLESRKPFLSSFQYYKNLLKTYQNVSNHQFTENIKTRTEIIFNRIKELGQ